MMIERWTRGLMCRFASNRTAVEGLAVAVVVARATLLHKLAGRKRTLGPQ